MNLVLFLLCFLGINMVPATAQTEQKKESVEAVLEELDYVIQRKEEYDQKKEHTIQSIKDNIPLAENDSMLYTIYNQLYQAYYNYQTDSAMHYVDLELQLAPRLSWNVMNEIRMNQSVLFSTMGMYKESIDALNSIRESELTRNEKMRYMNLFRAVYSIMADYALTNQTREDYLKTSNAYVDSLLSLYTSEDKLNIRLLANRLIQQGKYEEAIETINSMPSSDAKGHLGGLLAFDKASAYRGMHDTNQEIYYLAQSAMVDIKLSIKEYMSLYLLAFLLYDQGDVDRAYTYLKRAMDDAVFCNARFRTISITQSYPVIEKAYQLKIQKAQKIRFVLTCSISVLFCFLIVTVIYIYRQMLKLRIARKETSDINQQLKKLNERLYEVNQELSTANTIKQDYLVHYLEQCSMYLDKMENYRRTLENYAITSDMKGLFKAIKSETHITEEREKFYKSFDETFLNLFPKFVESFNQLLRDDERIYPKGEELLSPDLRIFALIRLGITDSNKIAKFLRYSLITIYNYRSKVRNKAKDKKDFENQVRDICNQA